MPNLRVLNRIARPMQRLGYLKRLIRRITSGSTSNLDNVGNDLLELSMKKVKVDLNEERASYIRVRLFDRVYKSLKEQVNTWEKDPGTTISIQMEIQDLYLADPSVPSRVGKLVKEDWRKYPPFGINLGLIREGTYSANTRALSLLYLTAEMEQKAFLEYIPEYNPLKISQKQGILFLYSLIENDGEVVLPLFSQLLQSDQEVFSDRAAGNFLPEIYSGVISRYRTRSLAVDLRERLEVLEKSAQSIIGARKSEKYEGGSAREESIRPRLEPYVDIGLFTKPNPMKYEYSFSPIGRLWVCTFTGQEDSAGIEEFLSRRFFQSIAKAWEIDAEPLTTPDEVVPYLKRAAKAISSSSGYAPIEELALLSGIEALVDEHKIFETGAAREAIIAYQKANPYQVRFTVDRMGVLAHAKFMEDNQARPST